MVNHNEESKEKGRDASRSKDSLAKKEWEVAWNFVNITAGNKTEAYCKFYRDHNIPLPKYPAPQASKFFNRENVIAYVEQFREENAKTYDSIRDENIAMLRNIASIEANKKTDRIAAMKELNSMMGWNQTNVSVGGKDIEITITE